MPAWLALLKRCCPSVSRVDSLPRTPGQPGRTPQVGAKENIRQTRTRRVRWQKCQHPAHPQRAILFLLIIFPTTAPTSQRSYNRDLTIPTAQATAEWQCVDAAALKPTRSEEKALSCLRLRLPSLWEEQRARNSTQKISTAFLYSYPDWTELFPAPA